MRTRIFDIPCHLIEWRVLERFLEEKAGNGYLIREFDQDFTWGKFEEVSGIRHICVDLYHKPLTRETLEGDGFLEYRELCRDSGWEVCCTYQNLVICYSVREERPLELQTGDVMPQELLTEISLRAERRILVSRVAKMLTLTGFFAVIFSLTGMWSGGWDRDSYLVKVFFLALVVQAPAVLSYLEFERLQRKALKGELLHRRVRTFHAHQIAGIVFYLMMGVWKLAEGVRFSGAEGLVDGGLLLVCGVLAFLIYRAGAGDRGLKRSPSPRFTYYCDIMVLYFAVFIFLR